MTASRCRPLSALGAAALLVSLASPALAGHESLDGAVRVVNDRVVALSVTIDGEPAGVVGPRSVRTLPGVPNGVRLVRLESDGAAARVERVSVAIHGLARVRVAPVLGSARFVNDSGVGLRLTLDGRRIGQVPAGGRLDSPALTAGRHVLTAAPIAAPYKAGPKITQGFAIRAGAETRVVLAPWLATLEIHNPMGQRAGVFVNGVRVGGLASGAALVLPEQVPGAVHLSLRSEGVVRAEATVSAGPGERLVWKPQVAVLGSVQVTNLSRGAITLTLGGRTLGTVSPSHAPRLFTGLPAGEHDLTATFAHGRRVHYRVIVGDGAVTPLTIGDRRPAPHDAKAHTPRYGHKQAKEAKKVKKVKQVYRSSGAIDVGAVVTVSF